MATTTVLETTDKSAGHADIELHPIEHEAEAPSSLHEDANSLNKKNVLKIVAAGFSFFFAGTNDGSLGALTPYILRTYKVGTEYVALMYVRPAELLSGHEC